LTTRSFAVDVRTLPLEQWESDDGRIQRGVWEHTPGVSRDVEADELFVVVDGHATIEIQDGPTLHVGPGDAAVLRAGDLTVWHVSQNAAQGVPDHHRPDGRREPACGLAGLRSSWRGSEGVRTANDKQLAGSPHAPIGLESPSVLPPLRDTATYV
jgi:uncharacterized cupin superfamily protein